ncbi:HEAT repeat domain-containing protein [Deinococcus gobiensis]|uniref:HEAT repeat domain-containing protein n=1 Tax=Deinococcus gobiensis (strain DSM 21396 / JCM 16679 / CGMCC 1.7299 / I-0) TaxID=745776 RepID=H8H3Y2_DEIGI|nr:HEAT repeat domain-containing protein [Deinococcus gobiensis]AFD28229.1 hypothetical protein DGo_PF0006 [Deinococcus gobiensis I-0]
MDDKILSTEELISIYLSENYGYHSYISTKSQYLSNFDRERLIEFILKDSVNKDDETRADLLDLIGFIDKKSGVHQCIVALQNDRSELVKRRACWILQNIGNDSAVDALHNAILHDKSPGVRIDAIDTLSDLKSVESLWVIETAFKNDSGYTEDTTVKEVAEIAINYLNGLKSS